jgi:thiol-disulfide isomerase/thioredoxin
MAAFITRLFKSFVEDVLVQRISDSRAVQQLAVRAVDASKGAKTALENPETIRKFASELWSEVAKQAEKDLANVANARSSSSSSSTYSSSSSSYSSPTNISSSSSTSSSSTRTTPIHVLEETTLSLEELLANNTSGKAILYFTAPWCVPSKTISPIFSSLAETASLSSTSTGFFSVFNDNNDNNKILFVKINVDENHAAAVEYGIQSVPTFMAVNGGKVVKIWNSADAASLKTEVEKLQ